MSAARREVSAALRGSVPADAVDALDLRIGRCERVLARAAADWNANLVVIGGKRHGALARGLGLSTAQNLVRMVEVPVLVAGAAAKPIQRVLVAVDLSAESRAVLSAARALAKQLGARLRIVHVLEPLKHPSLGLYTLDERLVRAQATAHLRRLTSRMRDVAADQVIREGDPAEVIAAESAEWTADLLVVGSHGRGWIDRLLLGSTTERLLARLPCSLFVIPIRERRPTRAPARTAKVPRPRRGRRAHGPAR
jgi:nucleotide-binding universal stress UspA family protein